YNIAASPRGLFEPHAASPEPDVAQAGMDCRMNDSKKMRLRYVVPALLVVAAVCSAAEQSVFPYGAVYFRKSNPPEQDWARDHQTAARIGMNMFRHWFMWSAIEVAPGKYDWRDYDRMMDLAAQNGIKVVIAELITAAPEWMFRKYAQGCYDASDGADVKSSIGGRRANGGHPRPCL